MSRSLSDTDSGSDKDIEHGDLDINDKRPSDLSTDAPVQAHMKRSS